MSSWVRLTFGPIAFIGMVIGLPLLAGFAWLFREEINTVPFWLVCLIVAVIYGGSLVLAAVIWKKIKPDWY